MLPLIHSHTVLTNFGVAPHNMKCFDDNTYMPVEDITTQSKRCWKRVHLLHEKLRKRYEIAFRTNNMDTAGVIYAQLTVVAEILRILLQEISLEDDPTRLEDLKNKEKNRLWLEAAPRMRTVQEMIAWQNTRQLSR